jgi:hypothetical protein
MTIPIPGTIFEQFHSGWKITVAYIYGAGYRAFVESPSKGIALSFIFQPENTQKLYDSLRVTNGNQEEPGIPETS